MNITGRSDFNFELRKEYRIASQWFPVGYLTLVVPLILLHASNLDVQLDVFELKYTITLGVGIAFIVGLVQEWRIRELVRSGEEHSTSEDSLASSCIASSLAAVITSVAGVTAALVIALSVRAFTATHLLMPEDAIAFLFTVVVAGGGLFWLVLTSGRLLLMLLIPIVSIEIVVWSLIGDSFPVLSEFAIYFAIPGSAILLALLARTRCCIPVPWACLGVVPLSILPIGASALAGEELALLLNQWSLYYILPVVIFISVLHYGWTSDLIGLRVRNRLIVAFVMAFPALVYLSKIQPYNASPLSREFVVYLAAGLVFPFVWFPLLIKWQQQKARRLAGSNGPIGDDR